jgi:hypothetical protein
MSGVTLGYFSQSNNNLKTEWGLSQGCKHCLYLELGCRDDNKSCLKTAERIAGDIACKSSLEAGGSVAPFEEKAAGACQLMCSKNIEFEFGAGYTRPYQLNNASEDTQRKRGEEGNKPVPRA